MPRFAGKRSGGYNKRRLKCSGTGDRYARYVAGTHKRRVPSFRLPRRRDDERHFRSASKRCAFLRAVVERIAGRYADAECRADADPQDHAHADTVPDSDSAPPSHADADTASNTQADTSSDATANTASNAYAYANAHADTNADAYANADTHPNSDTHADAYASSDTHANSNADAIRDPDRDADMKGVHIAPWHT